MCIYIYIYIYIYISGADLTLTAIITTITITIATTITITTHISTLKSQHQYLQQYYCAPRAARVADGAERTVAAGFQKFTRAHDDRAEC